MTTTEMIDNMDRENEQMKKSLQLVLKKNRYLMEQLAKYCTKQEYDRIWDMMVTDDLGGDL